MSKIYDKYKELRAKNNENVLYLFKNGIFFIFVDEDAKIASNLFHLKVGYLNENIIKCGFPINSLTKYLHLLKNTPYSVEIVNLNSDKTLPSSEYVYFDNIKEIVDEFVKIDIDSLSISKAYETLYDLQKRIISLKNETNL